jgi:hypothetical protein
MDDAVESLDVSEGRKRIDSVRQLEGQDARSPDCDRFGRLCTSEELALESEDHPPGEAGRLQSFFERASEANHVRL